jgi:hypothetical protein
MATPVTSAAGFVALKAISYIGTLGGRVLERQVVGLDHPQLPELAQRNSAGSQGHGHQAMIMSRVNRFPVE